jgi:hypothetical protein
VYGFFKSTLPRVSGPFSFALIDCGLGVTVQFCLENLFQKMSSGGIVLIDEYVIEAWSGVKPAVDDFIAKNSNTISRIEDTLPLLIQKA